MKRSFVYTINGKHYRDDRTQHGTVRLRASGQLDRKWRDDQTPEQERINTRCALCTKERHTELAHEEQVYG